MTEITSDKKSNFFVHTLNDNDKEVVLTKLGRKLYEEGCVKESFVQAVLDREKIYPTGLPTQGVGIAIPHTDSIHVNKKAIIIGILESTVEFQVMGSTDEFVQVGIIFMLAIENPEAQLEMLQKLIELCQSEEVLYTLKKHEDKERIKDIVAKLM